MTATTAARPATVYVDVTEDARRIRAALKKAYPTIRWSVRSSRYSGGSHVSVEWTDGPTSKAVEDLCKPFEGASFDGMEDLKSYHYQQLPDGSRACHQNDWTSTRRRYSMAFLARIAADVARYHGQSVPVLRESHGDAYVAEEGERLDQHSHRTLRDAIMEAAQQTTGSKRTVYGRL